ncbi:MAG: hypothetical protein R6U27_01390 [Desulfobacterales bacterium]
MKQYVIDQLSNQDYHRVKDYLDKHFKNSGMEDLYWIPIDENLLTEIQKSHTECQPFFFAVEVVPNKITWELLLRTNNRMHCSCMEYANDLQISWLIGFADSIFDRLKIKI